jgi:hypothetical protein
MASRQELDFRDIQDIFDREGVPFDTKYDAWKVQGTPVIYHKALERLAAKMNITFEDPKMMVQKDDELVMFVRGYREIGKDVEGKPIIRSEWSFAEVTMNKTGANYRVSGKQAGYPWAMLEKRGKDRVILKLAGIEAYSEEEADEFKEEGKAVRKRAQQSGQTDERDEDFDEGRNAAPPPQDPPAEQKPRRGRPPKADQPAADGPTEQPAPANDDSDVVVRLKKAIDDKETTNAVSDFMLDKRVQDALGAMSDEDRDAVRGYAKKRLGELGWPGKAATG